MDKIISPILVAIRALNSLGIQEECDLSSFLVPSVKHRRAVSVKKNDGSYISLKGVGWVHGPPYYKMSPTYKTLWYGLMDLESAKKEVQISHELRRVGVDATHVLGYSELTVEDFAALGVDELPTYHDNQYITPVVLATRVRGLYRIRDCTPHTKKNWLELILKEFDPTRGSVVCAAEKLISKIISNIDKYQSYGYVNETLSSDNITIFGEITDFERIVCLQKDGYTNSDAIGRQKIEAAFFLEVVCHILENCHISPSESFKYINNALDSPCNASSSLTPFMQELLMISKSCQSL